MKILVLNGSPKGDMGVSYHHVLFLEKHYKSITFEYIHIGKMIKTYHDELLGELIETMSAYDCVMWAYPVYTFSVPYQLMLFMNRLQSHPKKQLLKDVYTVQLSTSKHFFDITAYNYMKTQLKDLEMIHIEGLMADMDEMLKEPGRHKMIGFMDQVLFTIQQHFTYPNTKQIVQELYHFKYSQVPEPDKLPSKILVVYNGKSYSETLKHMISAFENLCSYEVHRLDISNINIQGGCLGCLKCTFIGHCIYRDEFEEMYQKKILDADVLVYASDIKNHYLHEDFKLIDDRAFYNGHRVNTDNKATCYLLTGHYNHEHNLRHIIEARAHVGHMALFEPVTNESDDIIKQIKRLCEEVEYFMEKKPMPKTSFYGIGGMKVFRDLIFNMRSLMIDDHDYYKTNGLYDFPKKHYFKHFFIRLGIQLISSPKRFKKYAPKMNKAMLARYKKVVDDY
ncbi:MAG: NAD(P)H-dependent oxidoreductase [Clostridiales bacterium]|nr:NAD(P)H-dependent oxidoreductase [Clostridiales bacterium]